MFAASTKSLRTSGIFAVVSAGHFRGLQAVRKAHAQSALRCLRSAPSILITHDLESLCLQPVPVAARSKA